MKYYSQYEQDVFIDKVVLNKKRNGFFVDIGAYDGIVFSNSYFFEKNRNYSGVCVEPNPLAYKQLAINRESKNLNVCIGDVSGTTKFLCVDGYGQMLSCIYDESNVAHMARVDEAIKQHGGRKEIIEIDIIPFDKILTSTKIDFVTLDTEGYEREILSKIDFEKFDISVIVVKINDNSIISFLK